MLRYLFLDLDNTLYSESYGLEHEVYKRMTRFAADFLGLSLEEAVEKRKGRMAVYGTTLEWLMKDHGFRDVEGYFRIIHPEGEEEPLSPDPALGRLLDSIKLPKAIFTNAPMEHATRLLSRIGVADRFEAIYDIRFNGLKGKPHRDAVERVCAACGVSPREAILVDDVPRYAKGFCDAGGRGILIDELDRHKDFGIERIHSLVELPGLIAACELDTIQPGLF
jgi:putative hydrolase of the HAD superfamily